MWLMNRVLVALRKMDDDIMARCLTPAVNESYMTNINRIYYWHITNSEDFLHRGAIPQVIERGPYVYREVVHSKVDVQFLGTTTQFVVWRQQHFDVDLTTAECGLDCKEHDNLTVMNVDFLQAMTSSGGDEYQLVTSYLPCVLRSSLQQLADCVGINMTSLMTLLADADCEAVDRCRLALNYPNDFRCFSFAAWLTLNDTDDKAALLAEHDELLTSDNATARLYSKLTQQCQDYVMINRTCVNDSDCESLSSSSDLLRALVTVRNGGDIDAASRVVAAELCSNDTAARSFTPPSSTAYIRVLSAYVTSHLAAYVIYRAITLAGNDIVATRAQSRLALGDDRCGTSGILEHYRDAETAARRGHRVTVYNCYDAVLATTNGHWQSFDGQDVFIDWRISRTVRHEVGPSAELRACASSYQLSPPSSDRLLFVPEFRRVLNYRVDTPLSPDVHQLFDWPVIRLVFNSSNMAADGVTVTNTTAQTGYMSWISLPHFLYANISAPSGGPQQTSNFTPSESRHLPLRDFEPMTGAMWRDSTRYQLNVGVDDRSLALVRRSRPLAISYFRSAVPVYWVDKSSELNGVGFIDFHDRVGGHMTTSCGGLVALTIIACLIIIGGVLVATVTVRDGRVAPIETDNTSFF